MIPACRDEISTCPAETDFTLRLHVEEGSRLAGMKRFTRNRRMQFMKSL